MQLQVEWLWIDFDCELQWKITTAMWKWKWKPNHGWTTLFSAKKHIPLLSHSHILSVLHFFLFPFIIFLLSTQFSLVFCPQKYAIKFMQPSKVCYKIYAMPQITENLIECVCIIVYVKVEGVAFSISIYYQKKMRESNIALYIFIPCKGQTLNKEQNSNFYINIFIQKQKLKI